MSEKESPPNRQEAVKQLLTDHLISDQQTLVDLLKKNFGIETNQSVLSRDLRRLGVTKKEINREMVYALPDLDIVAELLRLAIVDIHYNETMIVVKTHPGLAAFVGDHIDRQAGEDILGCLAGENVVFIACRSVKKIHETYETVRRFLHFKKSVV